MQIHISENKSVGNLRPVITKNCVRVFVDQDYHYGYFVDEHKLFSMLTESQKAEYLASPNDVKFDVAEKIARDIIDIGVSPFKDKK